MGKLREMLDGAKTPDDINKIYESEEYKNAGPFDAFAADLVLLMKSTHFRIDDIEKRIDKLENKPGV